MINRLLSRQGGGEASLRRLSDVAASAALAWPYSDLIDTRPCRMLYSGNAARPFTRVRGRQWKFSFNEAAIAFADPLSIYEEDA